MPRICEQIKNTAGIFALCRAGRLTEKNKEEIRTDFTFFAFAFLFALSCAYFCIRRLFGSRTT